MAKIAAATLTVAFVLTTPAYSTGLEATQHESTLTRWELLPGLERHPALHPFVRFEPPAAATAALSAPPVIDTTPTPVPISIGVDNLSTAAQSVQDLASCIRQHENGWAGYTWGFPAGTGDGGGAYQFMPGTWASANALFGGDINDLSPTNQDNAFLALFEAEGAGPWSGDGCA